MSKKIACIGDSSDHGGTIITSNQNGTVTVGGIEIAVEGALHSCPIAFHGITPITAVTTKSYINGELILTEGAIAGCGAVVTPSPRNVFVE